MKHNNSHKASTILDRVKSWYIGRDRAVPETATIMVIVGEIIEDIDEIPEIHVCDCWVSAKKNSEFMPRGCDLLKAWREDVSRRPVNAVGYLSAPKSHVCIYCAVVATRLGTLVPDLTQWEVDQANGCVTNREISCVLSTIKLGSAEHKAWNEKQTSPYRGML